MKCWETEFSLRRQADPHQIYKELWQRFDRCPGRSAPFLWLLTEAGLIRMRSREHPRVSEIGESLRWLETRRIFYDSENGECWRFVMVCNPTKRDRPSKGKRRSLIDPDDVRAWLIRKGQQHGFDLIRASVRNLGPVRWTSSSRHRVNHGSVEVSGVLRITDQKFFEIAMLDGIGAAKSAGMGMMILEEPDYGYAAIGGDRKADECGGNANRIDRPRRIIGLGDCSA